MFVARLAAIAALTLSATSAVLAQVTWTGAAGDNLWFSPGNWSTGVVPQPGQSVTINVPGSDPTILVRSVNSVTIDIVSLALAERLDLGPNITFRTGSASCSASVALSGGIIDGGAWTFLNPNAFVDILATSGNTITSAATIAGEIVLGTANARLRIDPGTRFTAARLAATNAGIGFAAGYTLHDQVIVSGGANVNAAVETIGTGLLTISPSGSVVAAPGFTGTLTLINVFWFGGTMNLINNGLIQSGPTGTFRVTCASFTNNATVRSTGGTLDLNAVAFTNATTGSVIAEAGVVQIRGNWSNAGTIDFTGTRLDLDGTFNTASLAGLIVRNASPVDIVGTWDNTASSFTFNQSTGSWRLNGGSITGGTINSADNNRLLFGPNSSQLNAVNYTGELILDQTNARLRLTNGASAQTIRLSTTNTSVAYSPNTVVNTTIIADGSAPGSRAVEVISAGPLSFAPSASVQTQGTWTGTLQIGGAFWFSAATNLSNLGSIAVTGNGRTLTFNPASLTNHAGASISASASSTLSISPSSSFTNEPGASVAATSSTLNITPTSSFTNNGSISVTDGAATFAGTWSTSTAINATNSTVNLGGSFTTASALRLNRAGGTVNITGALNNTADTLPFSNATGSWVLAGGTITGGSVTFADSHRLEIGGDSSNTLSNVTLANELRLALPNGRVRITNGTTVPSLRFTNVNNSVAFPPGTTINFPITLDAAQLSNQAIEVTAAGTLSTGPAGSITVPPTSLTQSIALGSGFWFTAPNIINQGTIEIANGRTLSLGSTSNPAVNQGILRARNASTITAVFTGPQAAPDLADTNTTLNASGTFTFPSGLSVGPGVAVSLNGVWSVPGPLVLNQGALTLGGTFTPADIPNLQRTAGSVSITGVFDLSGGTYTLNNATGSFILRDATLRNGTLARTGGNTLDISGQGTLDNVTFPQQFLLSGNGANRARFLGTTSAPSYRLSGINNSIGFQPGTVLNTDIIIDGPAGTRAVELNGQPGNLTLGPASRILVDNPNIALVLGNFWFSGSNSVTTLGLIDNPASLSIGSLTAWTNFNPATRTLAGGRYRLRNSITTSPTIRVNNADLEFTGGSFITLDLAENRGRLALINGTDVSLNPFVGNPDRVTNFINSGLLELGPGSFLQVGSSGSAADFTQTPTGDARFILAGDSPAQHGRIRVFGNVFYDGTLSARTADGFERQCGMIFDVIDADGQRTGGFSTLDLPAPTEDNVVLAFAIGPDVRLTVSSRADFNQDGFLDFFDFSEYVDCFEGFGCPPGLNADFNDDGFVDFFDFSDFVFRFEAGC
ncbi:MAG: hypothetical protein HRU70_00690 [Phycisphaeraceae bacterium]|nr:MAG: hypothetical protein HRU70_00690 [Phycisphaeraceae bacterium]